MKKNIGPIDGKLYTSSEAFEIEKKYKDLMDKAGIKPAFPRKERFRASCGIYGRVLRAYIKGTTTSVNNEFYNSVYLKTDNEEINDAFLKLAYAINHNAFESFGKKGETYYGYSGSLSELQLFYKTLDSLISARAVEARVKLTREELIEKGLINKNHVGEYKQLDLELSVNVRKELILTWVLMNERLCMGREPSPFSARLNPPSKWYYADIEEYNPIKPTDSLYKKIWAEVMSKKSDNTDKETETDKTPTDDIGLER